MSSSSSEKDTLQDYLTQVLAETPALSRSTSEGNDTRNDGAAFIDGGYVARINKLTFAETDSGDVPTTIGGTRSGGLGTSTLYGSSLFVDIGLESNSSSDGQPMLSARSTGGSTIATMMDTSPTTYNVYQFPMDIDELSKVCCQRQSGGISACVCLNCKLNHDGPRVKFNKGAIVVARSKQSVFMDPCTDHSNISTECIKDWSKNPRSLEDWIEIFQLVNNQAPDEVFTIESLQAARTFNTYAKGFRSPSTRIPEKDLPFGASSTVFSDIIDVETGHAEQLFETRRQMAATSYEGITSERPLLSTGELNIHDAFGRVQSWNQTSKGITATTASQLDSMSDAVHEELRVLISKLSQMEGSIGQRTAMSNPAYNAPSIWGSLSLLAASFDSLKGHRGGMTASTIPDDTTSVSTDISSIKVAIRSLGTRLDSVVEGRETKSIKFFGITFRSHLEGEAWVADNLDGSSYGLIIDIHLVLKHIYHQFFSVEGSLQELNILYKIEVDNLSQGMAITSFDFAMPKFFSVFVLGAGKKPKIRKPDSSHFDNIESYDDLDMPLVGFRAKFRDGLEVFESTHSRMISEALEMESQAYRVAMMSMSASVSWIQTFIAYIDETYLETSRLQSFTTARAWQLVTQIGRRILQDIAAPRNGVKKLFRVGDNERIAKTMFWPMVQCHDIMGVYKKANLKDHPAVGNEFTKFMATNSGSNKGLEEITSKLAKIDVEIKEVSKELPRAPPLQPIKRMI